MHILNLLETQHQINVHNTRASSNLKKQYSPKYAGMSRGSFSAVKPDPKDPHMVKKFSVAGRSESDEGFKAFIMFLHNNDLADNIHMPRVYDIKTVKGRDGIVIDSYRIEKLISMNTLSREDLVSFIHSITDEMDIDDEYTSGDIGFKILQVMLSDAISKAVSKRNPSFKLDSLNEACHIVARALHATGGDSDMYGDNLMFRRTQQGLQLVFSDPIYIAM